MHDPESNQNLEQHEVKEVLRFLKRYGKLIGAGVAAAAISAIAFRGCAHHKASQLAEAEQMLQAARTPEDIQTVAEDYSSTAVGPVARLELAKTLFNNGDYTGAHEQYETFLKKYKGSDLTPTARLGVAACSEAEGTLDRAIDQYTAFIADYPDHYLQPMAVIGLARTQEEAGNRDQARIILEDFLTENPSSTWAGSVESTLQEISE